MIITNPIHKNEAIISIFISTYIVLSLNINLKLINYQPVSFLERITQLFSQVEILNFYSVICFIVCYLVVKSSLGKIFQGALNSRKQWICHILPAVLFALFMIVGHSFFKTGSSSLLIANGCQIIKALIVFSGYFLLFLFLIIQIYQCFDYISLNIFAEEKKPFNSLYNRFYFHSFICSFLLLLICYIPYIVLSYPGIFVADFSWQFAQSINAAQLSNHHPVFHTFLIKLFIQIGKKLGSYNFGLFLYSLFQVFIFLSSVSFTIKTLIRHCHVKSAIILSFLLYFLIHPRIHSYMMLLSKDVIYTAVMLVFFTASYLLLKKQDTPLKLYLFWLVAALSTVLLRNEGIYLILPMLLVWCLNEKSGKYVRYATLLVISFMILWNRVFLPCFDVAKGSVREMLSIPFQQTARYVKLVPDRVTKEEKHAINTVLDYQSLAKKYNPTISDPVKSSFKERSKKSDRVQYAKAWFVMFKKEPQIYLDALLANKYEYFYPNPYKLAHNYSYSNSEKVIKRINKTYNKYSPNFSHPKELGYLRTQCERIREQIFRLPVICTPLIASAYIWFLVLLLFYIIRINRNDLFLLTIPCIMQFFVLIAGPTNGSYFRYVYPLAVWLPFIFIFILSLKESQPKQLLEKENIHE